MRVAVSLAIAALVVWFSVPVLAGANDVLPVSSWQPGSGRVVEGCAQSAGKTMQLAQASSAGDSFFGRPAMVGKSNGDARYGRDPGSSPVGTPRDPQQRLADASQPLQLENIQPLYTSPALPGEGVWVTAECPYDVKGNPIIYRTFYRPSVEFPNAVVYMMVVDMSKVFLHYYVGSHEPAAPSAISEVEPEFRDRMVAITNAMWMQRHSKGGGAIFRGRAVYPMVDGMATLLSYVDGSVDIREWSSDIPLNLVRDARQLQHLIVNNGLVVQSVLKGRQEKDAEIGLGFLLGGGGRNLDGKHFWYVAHRSAFGIRNDGNLVFAIGHHIGSKDMAKALVLAGCERGIHGDANPHNIVGSLYVRDDYGKLLRRVKLSPEQSKYTLTRYEDGYTKDFFGFFLKDPGPARGPAMSREDQRNRRHR